MSQGSQLATIERKSLQKLSPRRSVALHSQVLRANQHYKGSWLLSSAYRRTSIQKRLLHNLAISLVLFHSGNKRTLFTRPFLRHKGVWSEHETKLGPGQQGVVTPIH